MIITAENSKNPGLLDFLRLFYSPTRIIRYGNIASEKIEEKKKEATLGLLKKLLFFFCLAFCSSGFSPDEDSIGIGRNFTHRNLRLTMHQQVPKIDAKLCK